MSITIRSLRNDIVDPNIALSSVLLKAKVIAYSLDSDEFKEWVNFELDGYGGQNVEVPEYRVCAAANYGQFSGFHGRSIDNQPIPVSLLPDSLNALYGELTVREGISAIETSMASLSQANEFALQAPWAAEAIVLVSGISKIVHGYALVSAWQLISKNVLESVCSTVRSRLLTFVLELEDQFPDIVDSENDVSNISKEQTKDIFVTNVLGGNNVLASGAGFTQQAQVNVQQNDISSLLKYVRSLNVADEDVSELRDAIETDELPTASGTFGSRVSKWIGKMTQKSLEGAWTTTTNQGWQALIGAISQYYGF